MKIFLLTHEQTVSNKFCFFFTNSKLILNVDVKIKKKKKKSFKFNNFGLF